MRPVEQVQVRMVLEQELGPVRKGMVPEQMVLDIAAAAVPEEPDWVVAVAAVVPKVAGRIPQNWVAEKQIPTWKALLQSEE